MIFFFCVEDRYLQLLLQTTVISTYLIILVKLKFKKFHSAFHPNFRFQLSQQLPEIKNSQVIKCIWSPWILMLLLRVWIYEFVRNDIARVFCCMKKTCGRVGRQRGWGEKNFNRLSPCFFLFKGSYFFKHCNFYVEHMLIKLENNVWRYCFSTRILKVTRYYCLFCRKTIAPHRL